MLWFAMTLALTAAQQGPVPYTAASPTSHELYAGPPVRPYEPSWDTPRAEGDGFMMTRRTLDTPAALDAYDGTYEVTPTDAEVIYQQGVASAALRADSIMGPLDGRWAVAGSSDGRIVLELLLMDRGDGALVEGAWRQPSAPDAALASHRLGALSLVVRSGSTLTIDVDDPDGAARLILEPDGARWRGTLERGGRATPVVMAPRD